MTTPNTFILVEYPLILSAQHISKIIGVSQKQLMNMIVRGQTNQYPPHLPHEFSEKYRWSRVVVESWLREQSEESGYSTAPIEEKRKRGRPRKAA